LHARVPPVLHRDIKPANVILRPDGAPALVDFGAVRTVFRTAEEGGSTVVGTFGYMPFEQYMGQASPASDLYALGATLLHLITGRGPSEFATGDGVVAVPADLPGGPVLRGCWCGCSRRRRRPATSRRARCGTRCWPRPLGPTEAPRSTALVRVQPSALAPGPRAIEGELGKRFNQVVIGPMQMLYSTHQPSRPLSGSQRMLAVLLGLVTFGIVPLVYLLWHASRRTRARMFFERGVPASGKILQVQKDSLEWFEITYEFTLEGVTHRGSDTMFPAVARLWQAGDEVEVLVLPDQRFDSIIVSSA
jgi:serine/threonine protein kinase